jgi:hypothetical protein
MGVARLATLPLLDDNSEIRAKGVKNATPTLGFSFEAAT